MDKETFVKQLSMVIVMAATDVDRLRYRRVGRSEFVDVSFLDGSHKPVNVTADSKMQLVLDVARALM